MRVFTLDKRNSIICISENTSYGFRHLATLCLNGVEIGRAKATYYNRTWECYEFETVLLKCIRENFKDKQLKKFIEKFQGKNI